MHGVDYQGKVASGTVTFGWLWLVVLLTQSDCRILWSGMPLVHISVSSAYQCSLQLFKNSMSFKNLVLQLWPKMLSIKQIAWFSDCQYLWKESTDLMYFLHEDYHQRKVTSETTTFGWVWPVVLLLQSDCRIFWSSVFLEGINRYVRFLD